MKQTTFTLLLLSVVALVSCRKDKYEPTLKQYDQTQILNYISSAGLTGMIRDTIGGDTTGMYYKIINPGETTATPLDYPTKIRMVYRLQTLDGTYISSDTINNHYDDYLGHIYTNKMPLGLQTAVKNLLKYPGASMRVLIPSHLAYGTAGYGSGSNTIANNKIRGNESLDYYVHVIGSNPGSGHAPSDISNYDDLSIRNYMSANNLSGYTKVESTTLPGNFYYYKTLTTGTGLDPITANSTITATYTGQIFNAVIFDGLHNGTNPASISISDFVTLGNVEALENFAVVGTDISILMPSTLGYADAAQTNIPPFSCLRFTWVITATTP